MRRDEEFEVKDNNKNKRNDREHKGKRRVKRRKGD